MFKKMIYLVCYVLLSGLVLPSLSSGGILYETSFDRADAVADWQVVSGTWQLDPVAGTYTSLGDEALLSLYQGRLVGGGKASDLVDYTLIADLENVGVEGALCARYQDSINYYMYRYHFGLEELQIYLMAEYPRATKIASEPFLAADLPEIYTLVFELEGTTLTGRLLDNGAELASVTVEDGTFASGPGGLRGWGGVLPHHYFALGKGPFWLWFLCARLPDPADGAIDVLRDVVLSWMPGEFAGQHDVYFGTGFDDVNDADRTNPLGVLANQGQSPTTYDPDGLLDFGQTYYWRIDEVNAPPDSTIFKGNVWSFTVEPVGYPIAGENITATASSSNSEVEDPNNTINGSGLDVNDLDLHSTQGTDMWLSDSEPLGAWIQYEFDKIYKLHEVWVWNSNQMVESTVGFGLRAVTIEYSANGIDWIELGDVPEFAQAPGTDGYAHNTTVDLSGITAKYVRLTASSNWGGFMPKYGLSEVRFFSIPTLAREPSPDSGATDVAVDVTLGFRAGREAAEHNVYLSSDEQAVIDGNAPVTTVTENSYSPSPLDVDSTYYWKVNEVNDAETTTMWQGDIWNFTTQEYLVVDDFELYNDLNPDDPNSNRIFLTWIDGYDNPAINGSVVGYAETPFAEQSIVYDGKQSMPLNYDNSTAGYSEATANVANLQVGQDWTRHGIKALTLRFSGDPNNAVQQMYVKVNGSKVTYDGDAENLKRIGWQMWYIDLSSLGVSLSNVTELSIGFERSGGVGGQGVVYFDGIRLYSHDRQLFTPVEPNNAGLMGYYPLDEGAGNTATDMSGNGHDGTIYSTGVTYGVTWISQGFINGGINIDGTAACRVELGTWDPAEGTGQLSLALWIKWAGSGNANQGLIGKRDAWNANEMMFGFRLSNASIRLLRAGSTVSTADGVMTPFIGEWAHVAVTFDGTTARIYLNGEEIQSGGFSFGNKTTADMRIGAYSNASDSFNGDIDEVRIYNRVLSPTEIAWLSGMTLPFDEPF